MEIADRLSSHIDVRKNVVVEQNSVWQYIYL